MLTPYQKRQKDEDFMDSIYTSDDFRSKKNSRKKKVNFQNKCVSSQNHRMKKEEGATVDFVGHFVSLPSLSGLMRLSFVGRKAFSTEEVQTIGKYS